MNLNKLVHKMPKVEILDNEYTEDAKIKFQRYGL